MKKVHLYILLAIVFVGCNNDSKQNNEALDDSSLTFDEKVQPAELSDIPWAAILDSSSQIISMTQTEGVHEEDLNLANVTESINRKYPEISLSNPTQKGDTVFVQINNSKYLTQGAGTMGAEIYLAESTYSFTQIPGISFVNFDFEVGDHASPGTFKRTDFEFKK